MIRIVYVDEQEQDREAFVDAFQNEIQRGEVEVIAEHPRINIDDMVAHLLDLNVEAIIVDFSLSLNDPEIKYDGAELLTKILEVKEGFPVYILTQNLETAKVDSEFDPSKVITKAELAEDGRKSDLTRKIIHTVDYYRKLRKGEEESYENLKKELETQGNLSDAKLIKLKELERLISSRINKKELLPPEVVHTQALKELTSILKEAQDFLNKVKK
jgi:hypothetical protein